MSMLPPEAHAIIEGRHSDPFCYLGPHIEDGHLVVRVYLPDAAEVAAVDDTGAAYPLTRLHPEGLFAGRVGPSRRHRLRARYGERVVEFDDAYRFPPVLSELDLHLLAEGTHLKLYDK